MATMWKKSRTIPIPSNLPQFQKKWEDYSQFKAINLFWSDCNYLSSKCRVTSWAIIIVLQHSTNIQSLLQLCQLKHTQSNETPTILNKTRAFQAKFNFSEGNVHNFWPISLTEKYRIWSKCNYFIWNTNLSQLDLLNWITCSLSKLQHTYSELIATISSEHVYSEPIATMSTKACIVWAKCNYSKQNMHPLRWPHPFLNWNLHSLSQQ